MSATKPQILLTNDDGILSPGLWAAAAALSKLGFVTVTAPRDPTLDVLLELDGEVLVVDPQGGHWVRFRARRVPVSPARPHGIDYSLTLHGPDGERLVGFDNAHPVGRRQRGAPHPQGGRPRNRGWKIRQAQRPELPHGVRRCVPFGRHWRARPRRAQPRWHACGGPHDPLLIVETRLHDALLHLYD